MFILCLLSKSLSGILSLPVGATSIPNWPVSTESVFQPASTLKPHPVSRRHHLPYHLVQWCLNCSANHTGVHPSHWDCTSTLCLVDICAAFPSHSSLNQLDIYDGFHHVNPRNSTYKHPNHKSQCTDSRYPMSQGRWGRWQEYSSRSSGSLLASLLAQHCPYISLTLLLVPLLLI